MFDWMKRLGAELDEIEANENCSEYLTEFLKMFMETLCDVQNAFNRSIYFFGETFYRFLGQANQPRVQAAVILLRQMVDCILEKTACLDEVEKTDYWYDSYHPDRMKLKRYVSVLGNPILRKKYLKL